MRVEIHRIGGDIYINGQKKAFAVDFNTTDPTQQATGLNVDWLIGWAKIGLLSHGHDIPVSHIATIADFEAMDPKP